ncbi:uncharacterized protein NPIL_308471 [Nephila pilipes]|uniref:Uncharacterized protein n=1 Tax=Nephila pilipes TaxID=299642 RepID=A0A8X6TLD9_NEPPI|nr:uncharacterized protein NPIL_308471 [Nephila pilipes]
MIFSSFLFLCLGALILSANALPPGMRFWNIGSRHRPDRPWSGYDHYHHSHHRYPGYPQSQGGYPGKCKYGRPCEDSVQQGYEDEEEQPANLGCSCFLYVERTIVFRRVNTDQKYPCSGYGLRKCSRYCDELFSDQGLRASSRQDACDVLGREVYISWHRKNQVCGENGPQVDIPEETPLCCRRGRPSLACTEGERTS